ncbi:hypothetical protein R3P38DRAFT_2935449 [Favolaschia claudopus]|uniref:Protein CPL1-like domain-containing protein n=1 Tax=Favolaschia claudopus TaxID=2862362 RepID=A0AAW0BPZ1_9AGAR
MRFTRAKTAVVLAASTWLSPLIAAKGLNKRDAASLDVCGQVNAQLTIPSTTFPFAGVPLGFINDCLCVSTLPQYVKTNIFAIEAVTIAGTDATIAELTSMINSCNGRTECHFPAHAVPQCKNGNPCFFTCQDGYTASPSTKPTECVCASPYTECNGQCGVYRGCPSTYIAKRELVHDCRDGFTACRIPGGSAKSYECIDTRTELESCGGCLYGTLIKGHSLLGEDCTTIPGVSDVSCIKGQCVVRKCMPGYILGGARAQCMYYDENQVEL